MSYGLTAMVVAEADLDSYFADSAEEIARINKIAVIDETLLWGDGEDGEESIGAFLHELKNGIRRVKVLDNAEFMPCPTELLIAVDRVLAELGAPELQIVGADRTTDAPSLLDYNFPARLPRPADFPLCGVWSAELISTAHEQLKNSDYTGTDDFLKSSVILLKSWLKDAVTLSKSSNETVAKNTPICIVGFYH